MLVVTVRAAPAVGRPSGRTGKRPAKHAISGTAKRSAPTYRLPLRRARALRLAPFGHNAASSAQEPSRHGWTPQVGSPPRASLPGQGQGDPVHRHGPELQADRRRTHPAPGRTHSGARHSAQTSVIPPYRGLRHMAIGFTVCAGAPCSSARSNRLRADARIGGHSRCMLVQERTHCASGRTGWHAAPSPGHGGSAHGG